MNTMRKTVIGIIAAGAISSAAIIPSAMASTVELEGASNTCRFIATKPKIDYGNAKRLTATVGRTGCVNEVIWFHGSLRRDMPGADDQILARTDPGRVNEYSKNLSSWATEGHTYFSFVSSSTGGSRISAKTTCD